MLMDIERQGGQLIGAVCLSDGRSAEQPKGTRVSHWDQPTFGTVIECLTYLVPEDDGGYSVFIPSLPGAVSQGETEAEAIRNIVEAFEGVVEVYKERGQPIPWTNTFDPPPENAKERRILLNV